MKKRMIQLTWVVLLAFSLTACGERNSADTSDQTEAQSEASTAAATETTGAREDKEVAMPVGDATQPTETEQEIPAESEKMDISVLFGQWLEAATFRGKIEEAMDLYNSGDMDDAQFVATMKELQSFFEGVYAAGFAVTWDSEVDMEKVAQLVEIYEGYRSYYVQVIEAMENKDYEKRDAAFGLLQPLSDDLDTMSEWFQKVQNNGWRDIEEE